MSPNPGGRLARWLLPDAAMLVAVLTLCYGLFFGDGAGKLFRDSDSGWHIRTGERILAGQPLPRTDPYSFTRAGQVWFAWEWGADVMMGAAHRWDGLRGVALLYAAVGALCTWAWFRLHWILGGNFFLACGMASPMLTTMSLHWLARPHVFSWLFALGTVTALEVRSKRFRAVDAFCWLAAGAVWANVHASFFFLPALCALYAVGGWLRRWLWGETAEVAGYCLAGLFAGAGTFLNPYGWGLHTHVARYLANGELLERIGEFQSFNFHAEGAVQILIAVGLVMLGTPLTLLRRRPEHFLLCCGLLAMALRSARTLPLVALLLLPAANGAITEGLARMALRVKLRERLDQFLAYSSRLRTLDSQCGGYAAGALAAVLCAALLRTPAFSAQAGFAAKEFPVAAAEAVAKLPSEARVLAPDKFGGYLIYRFQGERKVFFDGRSDFYGVGFMKEYIHLMEARPGWRAQVEEFGITHALLPNNYSLVEGLEQWGWKRMYRDGTATLLRK